MREKVKHCFEWQPHTSKRVLRMLSLFLIPLLLISATVSAQDEEYYDEIIASLNIPGIGNFDMPVIIKEDVAYIPVTMLFDAIKIKNTVTDKNDSVYGFFISLDTTYTIGYASKKITVGERKYTLTANDMIKTETGLYIKSEVFNDIFGLSCAFNFRSLSIRLTTKIELPAVREARLSAMRSNIEKLKNTQIADTYVKRSYPAFHFGMLDWSVVSNQVVKQQEDTRLGLSMGGVLAGGETSLVLNYSFNQKFNEKQQYYLWKHVNNDKKIIRQVSLGKVPVQATSSIFAPFIGAQVSNMSTIIKRSFGTYTLTNHTEPGWTVELYVNNVLVDYQKADGNGMFSFDVPLVYGNSSITLKYYGPFGEERQKEESVNIPYNLLPPGLFNYTATGGFLEDDSLSRFSKIATGYGVSKRLTIGTGVEYLSSVTSGNFMPYINTAMRIGRNLMVSGEYNYALRAKGSLSYRTRKNMQLELSYTQYDRNQIAINTQVLEERKGILSIPIRMKRLSMYSQFTVNQSRLANTGFLNTEWLLSGYILGVDANISTYGIFYDNVNPNIYSNFTLSFRLPLKVQSRFQIQYKYNTDELVSVKETIEKNAGSTFLGLYYEKNFISDVQNIGLQFRYTFPFAQVSFSSTVSNKRLSLLESVRGSIMYDEKTNYLGANNLISTGRGVIVIAPFLDIDCNGQKDPDEPRISGLKFNINGGNIQPEGRDTMIRILNLEPYNKYFLELNKYSFDNIAWQIKKLTYSITVDANSFKLIPVPIGVMGEVNGNVYQVKDDKAKGIGLIYVCIYKDTTLITKVLSEPDGYFSYIGLAPGQYTVKLDSVQMDKIGMTESKPISFIINKNPDGDVVDGLEFTISKGRIAPLPSAAKQSQIQTRLRYSLTGSVITSSYVGYRGQTMINVLLYRNRILVAKCSTNYDGSFTFKNIQPGQYTMMVDPQQIRKYMMASSRPLEINVAVNNDTTIKAVDGFQFILKNKIEIVQESAGKISGLVLLYDNKYIPQEEVKVSIYKDNSLIKHVFTNAKGQFDFSGLEPGEYIATLDEAVLKTLGMTGSQPVKFSITNDNNSDIMNEILFLIKVKKSRNVEKTK